MIVTRRWSVLAGLVASTPAMLLALLTAPGNPSATPAATEDRVAVESDMHEFMEYYFQPTYRRLKEAIAQEPENRRGWGPIKADGLILAESGNLLIGRGPQDKAEDWDKLSVAVRTSGTSMYEAAKGSDFAAARKHYEAMIENCNACHRQFANGKHILKP